MEISALSSCVGDIISAPSGVGDINAYQLYDTFVFGTEIDSLPPRTKEVSRGYSRAQTIGQRIIGTFTADGSLPTRDVVSVLE